MTNYSTGDPLRPWVKHIDDYFPYLKIKKEIEEAQAKESMPVLEKESIPVNSEIATQPLQTDLTSILPQSKQGLILAGIVLYLLLRK